MNKKHIGAGILFIALFTFSFQTAHASFFGNIITNIFGGQHAGLGAMALPTNQPDTSASATTTTTTTVAPNTSSSIITPSVPAAAITAPAVLSVSEDPSFVKVTVKVATAVPATSNITLGRIDLTATNGDIKVTQLPVMFVAGTSVTDPGDAINTLRLYNQNGVQLNAQVTSGAASPQEIIFFPTNLVILSGTTTVLTIKGDANLIGTTQFSSAANVAINVNTANVAAIKAISNGVVLPKTSLTGSAVGVITYLSPAKPLTPNPSLPAGCTSTTGYSLTTGQPCSGTSMTITYPNGGEIFQPGQQVNVTWNSTNIPATNNRVSIGMDWYDANGNEKTGYGLNAFTTNTGHAMVTIPSSLPIPPGLGLSLGKYFKMTIVTSDTSNTVLGADQSDNFFTIASPTTLPAGCTSTVGYSSTTGAPCSGVTSNGSLAISTDPNNASDHVVSVSKNSTITNVTLQRFDVSATTSNATINSLPVHVTSVNTGTAGANTNALVTVLRLYNSNGIQIDSEAVPAGLSVPVVFKNLAITIPAGTTQVFTIKADIAPIDGTAVGIGASTYITITPNDAASIGASGVVNGSKIYFYLNGIVVSPTSSNGGTATASGAGGAQTHSVLAFTIPFSVTAFGQQAYIPATAMPATTASAVHNIQFCIDNYTGACQSVGSGVVSYTGTDNLTVDANGNYIIPTGQTKNFALQMTYPANGPASYRASLLNVNWSSADFNGTVGANTFTVGLNSNQFRTNYVSAQ